MSCTNELLRFPPYKGGETRNFTYSGRNETRNTDATDDLKSLADMVLERNTKTQLAQQTNATFGGDFEALCNDCPRHHIDEIQSCIIHFCFQYLTDDSPWKFESRRIDGLERCPKNCW